MQTDRILKIFLYISLVIIGIIVGVTIRHLHNITVSEEVNLIDMATLVVTVFLAVYIPAVLDRKLQNSKRKQELLADHVNDYQGLLRRINMLVQGVDKHSVNDYLTIRNLLDIAQHKLKTFITLMRYANLKGDFEKQLNELKEMDRQHKELLWSDKMDEPGFSYSEEIESREEELYNRMDEAISILIFAISDTK